MGTIVGLRAAVAEAPAVMGISDRARAEAAARTVGRTGPAESPSQPAPDRTEETARRHEAA